MSKNIFILILTLATIYTYAQHKSHKHWSYEGKTGPAHWGKLKPEYALSDTGKEQSPIDIKGAKIVSSLKKLVLNYDISSINLVNNGHTVQCNYRAGSTLTVAGQKYTLLQFHFHTPSEHTVAGKSYPLEIHLVHKNAKGGLAVIGVFFTEGKENEFLANFWPNLPEHKGEVKIRGVLNAQDVLPKNKNYYTYPGSLTTPPCSEGVRWLVMQNSVEASKEQIAKIHKIMGKNARPVQPHNKRTVKMSAN